MNHHLNEPFKGFYDAVAPESTVETQCVQAVVSEEFSLDAYCNALKTPKLKGDVRCINCVCCHDFFLD